MNAQQKLRWFAHNHRNGKAIDITPEEIMELSANIATAINALDNFWETVAGRKLTDEEKWGEGGAPEIKTEDVIF